MKVWLLILFKQTYKCILNFAVFLNDKNLSENGINTICVI